MNSPTGTSWEVKARAHTCFATGEPFMEGQTIISRLIATVDGLVREDYEKTQWDGEKESTSKFFWKTIYHPPQPKPEAPFREENAAEALQELLEEQDSANTNTIFILAAMLERKRLWIERDVQRDDEGRRIRIYEQKETGETYFIVDPELSLDDLAALQEEVALKLGWIKPEEPSAETEAEPKGDTAETDEEQAGVTASE
jgi:hypothetical protein